MSGICQIAAGVFEAYVKRMTSNNPRTNELRRRTEAALRNPHKQALCAALVNEFAICAADYFAAGDHREGRRYYDGAFRFGNKDEVRLALLNACVAKAAQAVRNGNRQAVRWLQRAAQAYPYVDQSGEQIDQYFANAGVLLERFNFADRELWLHELPNHNRKLVAVAA